MIDCPIRIRQTLCNDTCLPVCVSFRSARHRLVHFLNYAWKSNRPVVVRGLPGPGIRHRIHGCSSTDLRFRALVALVPIRPIPSRRVGRVSRSNRQRRRAIRYDKSGMD